MRSKFEALCRRAQNDICKRIEELDGEGKVSAYSSTFACKRSDCSSYTSTGCNCLSLCFRLHTLYGRFAHTFRVTHVCRCFTYKPHALGGCTSKQVRCFTYQHQASGLAFVNLHVDTSVRPLPGYSCFLTYVCTPSRSHLDFFLSSPFQYRLSLSPRTCFPRHSLSTETVGP